MKFRVYDIMSWVCLFVSKTLLRVATWFTGNGLNL